MQDSGRETLMDFSFLIQRLYGDYDYSMVKTYLSLSKFKKYYLKILKSIKFSIEETITLTDKNHKEELQQTILYYETSINNAEKFDELDQLMITFQSKFIFLLIGLLPNRWESRKIINRRDYWKLNSFRQIQYVQNADQKKNVIFNAIQGKYKSRFGEWSDLLSFYSKECNNEPERLIEWIKKYHPDIYLDLF
jgi:hypothetical protein